METERLQELMDLLLNDKPLSEIAPPLMLANAIQYVRECDSSEDQADLLDRIEIRYRELCEHEVEHAFSFDGAVRQQDDIHIYTLFLNETGHLVPASEPYYAAVSSPRYEGPEELPTALFSGMAKSIHNLRVDQARTLMEEANGA